MKVLKVVKIAVLIVIVLFGAGFVVETIQFVPDYATVYVDTETRTYYSPIGLTQEEINTSDLVKHTLGEAEMLDCEISEGDKQNEYFYTKGSISGNMLRDIGVLPSKDRVDLDGNWLY